MDKPKRAINWGEAIVPGIGLAFIVAYFIQVINLPWIAVYWPVLIAVIMGSLWIMILFLFVFSRVDQANRRKFSISWFWGKGRKMGLVLSAFIGYLLALPYLGFSISNLCLLILLFRGLGSKKWMQNIVTAFITVFLLHIALIVFLKMSLPQLSIGKFNI
ncbi:tripartite tricarboxylate transporter TctB family protein [Candidatus Aerophobetes bacterium]|nr:tripartite tricarboxylate transporter TctB family protein [Candidatus Aerophobetes bacterium]